MSLKRRLLLILTILSAIGTLISGVFVFAEQNEHALETISGNQVEMVVRGITEDGRFEEPMLDITFIKQILMPLSVVISQGSTFVTSSGESEVIILQTNKTRLVDSSGDTQVFAYTLDYTKGFPKKSSLYELDALPISEDMTRILNNIVALELENRLSSQLAVWMTHQNVELPEIEKALEANFSDYTEEINQILQSNDDPVPLTTDVWLSSFALILFAVLTFILWRLFREAKGVIEQLTQWNELVKGGMADVWTAIWDGKKVVIKYPLEDVMLLHEKTVLYRLAAEIRNSERLTHPHIVPFIESGEYHHPKKRRYKTRYIIQEFIDGYTLHNFVYSDSKLTDNFILGIANQVLFALGYIHSKNVIHRDLTLTNIMINKEGKVYLIDLGNSTEINSTHTIIERLRHVGTTPFHAPESIGNTPAQDFYALAMLIYGMYGGELVKEGKTTEIRKIVGQKLDDLTSVPAWLRPVLKDCWDGKHQNSEKLREALRLPSVEQAITQVGEYVKNSPPNSSDIE